MGYKVTTHICANARAVLMFQNWSETQFLVFDPILLILVQCSQANKGWLYGSMRLEAKSIAFSLVWSRIGNSWHTNGKVQGQHAQPQSHL